MKIIIIPIDFSDVSLNAARYSAMMFSGNPGVKIILYNVFKNDDEKVTVIGYLESLKNELLGKGVKDVECISEMNDDFVDCLKRLSIQKKSLLIVMGITGKSALANFFIGSNTLKMIEQNVCPVMIVPENSTFKDIKNIALTCDFNGVENNTPTYNIKNILELFQPTLHIVNVNSDHYVSLTEEYQLNRKKLDEMFKEYNPAFYFIGMFDFYDTIEKFIFDKNIDLLITIPKQHSFFDKIFKGSHTKKLALHSKIPMLAAHA